jgi:hypothetical protein
MINKRSGRTRTLAKGAAVLSILAVPAAALATGPYPKELDGRMTGGGHYFPHEGVKVTHGFELHCDADIEPNNLQVNWQGNRFHLTDLTSAQCTDDPAINPRPRTAPFDTFRGTGVGRYNGVDGARIDFKLTDAGEPGTKDRIRLEIRNSSGRSVLRGTPALKLTRGNHQAHPENKK